MSRLSRLALRDLEMLSAYVDGTLSPAERQTVARRLEQDPSLHQALKELRTTSALLRALPQVRPPHNFTLTPEMAGVRSGWLRTPFLQLATAVATLAFAVTVGVDVLGGALPGAALRAAAPAPEMAVEAPAEVAAADAVEAGAAATLAETAVAEKAVVEQATTVAQVPVEAPAATPTAEGQAGEYASRAAPTVGGAAETPPPPSESAAAPMLGAEPAVGAQCEACGPDLVLPTTAPEVIIEATAVPEAQSATQEAVAQVVEPPAEQPTPEARLRGGVPAVRWLEIGLGAAALLLGGVTLWARRRAR